MDIQAALSVAEHFTRLARCADRFGWDRERLIEELEAAASNYTRIAKYTERQLELEAM